MLLCLYHNVSFPIPNKWSKETSVLQPLCFLIWYISFPDGYNIFLLVFELWYIFIFSFLLSPRCLPKPLLWATLSSTTSWSSASEENSSIHSGKCVSEIDQKVIKKAECRLLQHPSELIQRTKDLLTPPQILMTSLHKLLTS